MRFILGFALFLLGLVIGSFATYEFYPKKEVKVITKTDTIKGDSIPYMVRVEIPVKIDSIVYYRDTIYKDLDTGEIINEFFSLLDKYNASVFYNDTLKNDTSAFIFLSEEIKSNKVKNRNVIFANKRLTKIENTTIEQKANNIGIGVLGGKDVFSPSLIVIDNKRSFTYYGGYNIVNKTVNLGVFYNFKLKNKWLQ